MVVLFGAAGEIRTLRIGALDSKNDYTKNHSKVKHKFEKCAIF